MSSKWNVDKDGNPINQDEIITIIITFNGPGSDIVYTLIKDPGMPESYPVIDNTITIELDGVNEVSTGVLVLTRDRVPYPAEDINQDGYVDPLDVTICLNVILGYGSGSGAIGRADVNADGVVNTLDIQRIVNKFID